MRIDRNTVRIVAPPLLALGLVALLVQPSHASPLPTPPAPPAVSIGR